MDILGLYNSCIMKPDKIIKTLFLGPKAENQDLYESIILETIRDNCFLRKNFHFEDSSIISEADKLDPEYQAKAAEFKQKIQEILADLKKGVPLYHPRYIGHMHGDLLLPAVAAYFSTMLYNSNNVVGESSPATTAMEFDYIRNLCRMVGYEGFKDLSTEKKKDNNNRKFFQSFGHLCSGGHTANIEALWVARNMKYYPLSVKLAIANPNDKVSEQEINEFFNSLNNKNIPSFGNNIVKTIGSLNYSEAFNLKVSDILDLKDIIFDEAKGKKEGKSEKVYKEFVEKIQKRIEAYSVVELGVYGIHSLVERQKEKIELPKLYITKSYHYSWDKAMDMIGIGRGNVVRVEMTPEFSLDIIDLEENKYKENKNYPILAVVGILGSSKQGSIDPMDKIVEFRNKLEAKNKSFYFHIDGAYGGYFPALLYGETKETEMEGFYFGSKYNLKSEDDLRIYLIEDIIKEKVMSNGKIEKVILNNKAKEKIEANVTNLYSKLSFVKKAESYTIDPHKMGYVPYPAGGILYSDTRLKDFISYEPSYLNKPEDSDMTTTFIGQWTLEGSRPGAAAAACYMANQLLPFNQNGYGLLIRNTIQMANTFMVLINEFNTNSTLNRGYQIFPLYKQPETNIVEYVLVNSDKIKKVKYLNILTQKLYDNFSISGKTIIPSKNFMVAKEDFEEKDIHSNIWSELEKDHKITKDEGDKLIILSSVFMNPLSIYIDDVEKYYREFFKEMVEYAENVAMPEIMFQQIVDKYKGERIKALWIENEADVKNTRDLVLYKSILGKYLDIDFYKFDHNEIEDSKDKAIKKVEEKYQVFILDLNLIGDSHTKKAAQDDTTVAKEIYKSMDKEKQSKVVFCSQFFIECPKDIKSTLIEEFNFTDETRMIAKPKDEKDIEGLNKLVDAIFNIFNQ